MDGLLGGTRYYDGQFDDARLAINLATTAAREGAALVNYAPVVRLLKDAQGAARGVAVRDEESGRELEVRGQVIVNATGPFADAVRRMDRPDAEPIIEPSQGVHVVLDKSFLPGSTAIMVPHTEDGRVMFAIPWHGVAVVGTTDTPIREVSLEPRPLPEEVEFILETANDYLSHPARPEDILSVFAGIRPLVRAGGDASTAELSRDHAILIDPTSGLLTVAGGKWTTYRKMAEDVVDRAVLLGDLDPRECVTKDLAIHGADGWDDATEARRGRLAVYGSDAEAIAAMETAGGDGAERLHERLAVTVAEVRWAARHEMARTVDDVLARRTRALLLDARAAIEAAPRVAARLADELGRDAEWERGQVARFAATGAAYVSGDPGGAPHS
jgi:glycerol-3-phosphate dehydrogenase